MKRYGALAVLLLSGFMIGAKKPNPAKFLPPKESHGVTLTRYGCERQYERDMPGVAKRTAVWNLIVWAEYGTGHKRYWKKSYGTYEISVRSKVTSSGESAGASGRAFGSMYLEAFDFTPMNKACIEWGNEMESKFKILANGTPIKQPPQQ
jgi:hypothetical protein